MAQFGDSNIRFKVWLEPEQVEALRTAYYNDTFASYLELRNDAIIALLNDVGLRVGELVQVDVKMLRERRSELYLPGHIQKDYPDDNSPSAVTMELGTDTSRALNSYLDSRWKDARRYSVPEG